MDKNMKNKAVCIIDLDYVGLPLAKSFSKHLSVIGYAFGVNALDDLNVKVDCVIMAVAHDEFEKMKLRDLTRIMNDKPC